VSRVVDSHGVVALTTRLPLADVIELSNLLETLPFESLEIS